MDRTSEALILIFFWLCFVFLCFCLLWNKKNKNSIPAGSKHVKVVEMADPRPQGQLSIRESIQQ